VLLPISKHMNSLTVAFMDPLDLITIDNLKRMTNCEINPIIATKSDLQRAINEFYGKEDLLKDAVSDSYELEEFKVEKNVEEDLSLDDLIARAEEAPVVKLVDLILMQAIKDRASDIHIEPYKNKINIRYRIDGVLYEIPPPAKHLLPAIISRIKILSNLDIAERRLPQDGVFFVKVDNKGIDIRVSTIPAIFGEKVVMRILDKSSTPLNLGDLGFDPEELEQLVSGCRITPGQKRILMEKAPLIAKTLNEKIKTDTGLKTERVAALARLLRFREKEVDEIRRKLDKLLFEEEDPEKK